MGLLAVVNLELRLGLTPFERAIRIGHLDLALRNECLAEIDANLLDRCDSSQLG